MEKTEEIELIKKANSEMLDYFNRAFLTQLEDIQEIKTQIFELDVKMDELEKTKDLYAFKTNSRKSVFSPIISDGLDLERGKIINEQIEDMSGVRETLVMKIRSMEIKLNELKKKLAVLNGAADAIDRLGGKQTEEAEEEGFLFLEEPEEPADVTAHGYNVLMLDAFDKAVVSALLEKNVRGTLNALSGKVNMMTYLLGTDISRAKLTLKEIEQYTRQIFSYLEDVDKKLGSEIDSTGSLKSRLEEYLSARKRENPEVEIETRVEIEDEEKSMHPVLAINLLRLIDIFVDNVYRHADASKLSFRLLLTANVAEVVIEDNGCGISPGYRDETPWYTSMHRAEEILFLLGGKLTVSGDDAGTVVRFGFKVKDK